VRIGIIGSGNMGRALGLRFSALGHEVAFGARKTEQAQLAAERAGGARAGTNEDAARFGEVLVWTMRERDPGAVLAEPSLLDGKVLICVNNRDYQAAREGARFEEAIAEGLQANAPMARVVKAFNTIAMNVCAPASRRRSGAMSNASIATVLNAFTTRASGAFTCSPSAIASSKWAPSRAAW